VILTERRIEASTIVPVACINDRSPSTRSLHQRWSSSSTTNASGAAHYYFNDHLGAPVLQTDASGTVVWRVERDPYGERYATRVGAERHQTLGLPGQEYDPSSDRQYNIFRWYRPSWGRYTQPDPIDLNGGINLFAYVDARPTRGVDPLGLVTVTDDITRYYYSQVNAWLQVCPSGAGECGRIGVRTSCECSLVGDCWKASATVTSTGEINLYTGDFKNLPRQPANSSIDSWEDALAHAYDFHVKPAVKAAVKILSRTEAKKYNSAVECVVACVGDQAKAEAAFLETIRDTQAIEQRGWRR
jgi:RHS repeat-associated protein